MRISKVQKHVVLAVLLLVCTACQSGSPQAHTTPRPSVAPTVTPDAQRCARLAKRGFTPCPPLASQLKLPPTTIKNATNGAVDDATAQKWGRALQLGQAYYYWILEQNSRDALTSGVLADPAAAGNLFGDDLRLLDDAKKRGGVLVTHNSSMPITQAVVLDSQLQDRIRVQGLTPKPFGLAIRFQGPSSDAIRFPDGHEEIIPPVVGPDVVSDTMTWGELRADPDLGDIWYEFGYYGCEEIKSVCQL